MLKRFGLMTTTLLVVSVMILNAQPANRVFLGELEINFRTDFDVLRVGAVEGTFRRIMIEVDGNDVEILDLDVTFGNGARQDIAVRHQFREGSRSRIIDLRGGARVIRNIKVVYRTVGRLREGRATLKFYGIP